MNNIDALTIDWKRSILIDSPINDDLVKRLSPLILQMRQQSSDPITIGIDSPGGSLASLDIILGLLKGPDQNGNAGTIITVSTYRAYSSAANLLAFGNYAVALKHSQVLFHDVRFGELEDVTPEKARDAAKSLQDTNDAFALKLAHQIISRLIWNYINLEPNFPKIQLAYPELYDRFSTLVESYAPKVPGTNGIDLASFATALWVKLSPQNDILINNVMQRLKIWIDLTKIAKNVPTYRSKGSRIAGLLDGSKRLHKLFSGNPKHFESTEESMKLLLSLIIADISGTKTEQVNFSSILDRTVREFGILESMNDPKHVRYATDLMLKHDHMFFNATPGNPFESMSELEKQNLINIAAPNARLLWHFCVLLCRELFEGEHILNPIDAQLLGLVDEVAGGGLIQSRREYRVEKAKNDAKGTSSI